MKEVLLISAAIAVTVFIGWNVLSLISGRSLRMGLAETLAVSYGLGAGLISLEMFLFHIVEAAFRINYFNGSSFTMTRILLPWAVVVAANIVVRCGSSGERGVPKAQVSAPSKLKTADICLGAGILFEVLYAFFRALIKPIESYDAIAIYAIRSKIFFLAKAIPQDYFASIARAFPHADYPLNIQLFETFLYTSMGSLNDQLVKVIFPLFFVATLCMLYSAVRRFAGRTYSLAFTFILAGIPHFNNYATNAYLEMPLAFYIFAAGLLLLRWIEDERQMGCLIVSAVAAGLAGWTKNEGLMYCAIFALIAFVHAASSDRTSRGRRMLYAAAYSGIMLLICLPWTLVKARWHIVNDEIALANLNPANLFKQLGKLAPVAYEFQKQIFGPKKWNILWPVLIVALIVNWRRAVSVPSRYVLAMVVLALGGYCVFYMISYVDVVFFASKTWARFMLDFLPLAVFLLARILKEDIKC